MATLKSTNIEGNVSISGDVSISGNLSTLAMPIGAIIAYGGKTCPPGWLVCDGSSFDTSSHPELYSVLGESVLPNLVGRFIQGSNTTEVSGLSMSGRAVAAGLPNITGTAFINSIGDGDSGWNGALKTVRNASGAGGTSYNRGNLYLDASHSNSIYGSSTTVQPPALKLIYIIRG